jgi:hypothetical protein
LPFRLPSGAPPRAPWKRQTVQPFKARLDIPLTDRKSFLKKIFLKNGIHICVEYCANQRRYRYLTKAWGWE